MAFPVGPVLNQIHTNSQGTRWQWTGTLWQKLFSVAGGVAPAGSAAFLEERTLTAGDITNKFFVLLSNTITDASSVAAFITSAPGQDIGVDYTVNLGLNRLEWTGLGWDGEVGVGDVLTIRGV